VPGAPLLELRELRFCYPGAARPALDGVSLRLERGRRVAVVGASGAGKSTLAGLLLRFWPAPAGSILLEGHELGAWRSDAARARVAFAAQRAHVFTGTLRDNLLLARADAGEAELAAVVRAVRLDGLVARLAGGLDAWVGEEGQRLSGGERQRLALARALLRPAPLLLLDEPFAHLDALTEREVLAEVVRAGEGRATLLVTHRLVSLDAFDEIVVLDRGRVAERGSARELLARGGALARLAVLQRSVAALGDDAFAGPAPAPVAAEAARRQRPG
jgi:ATP-binding cassette subfamily C protein CydCD